MPEGRTGHLAVPDYRTRGGHVYGTALSRPGTRLVDGHKHGRVNGGFSMARDRITTPFSISDVKRLARSGTPWQKESEQY